ncbi:hypothetical protein GCM10020256_27190 [Streptomyces thermocoprophilus]
MQKGTTYMVRPRMEPRKRPLSPVKISRISAGGLPVVGRAGVLFLLGADEGPVLDPGDVGRVGGRVVGVGALDRVELLEGALGDELLAESLVLGLGSVTPDHVVRLRQFGDLVDPRDQFLMAGGDGSRVVARHDCS